MNIKRKLFALLLLLFVSFSAIAWLYSITLNKQLNEDWAERFIKKQVLFDKYRTLSPIIHEVAIVKALAQENAIKEMAMDENNTSKRESGIKLLESYRLKFKDRSYFAAFTETRNYYFNDANNSYIDKEYRYTLSRNNSDDEWFFTLLGLSDEYQINVNKDTLLGTTKVWINYLLKDKNDVIAVLGTGFDLTSFLKESVDIEQEGVRNLFIDKNMAIQLERDSKLIDYASLIKNKKEYKSLELVLKNKNDLAKIKLLMYELEGSQIENEVKTLWAEFENGQKLVGLSYLKELGWFNLTVLNPKELTLVDDMNVFIILSLLFFISLLVVNTIYNKIILHPLMQLQSQMSRVESGSSNEEVMIVGTGEIAELSNRFKKLLEVISANHRELEDKIMQRTLSLKENESKLNTILNSIEGYIYIKNLDGKYTYVNKHVCDLFEKNYNEIIGKKDSAFIDKKSADAILENDMKVIQMGVTLKEEEVRIDVHNTKKVYLSIKTPLVREDGSIYGLCGISTDISNRIEMEEKNRHLAFYDHLTDLPNRRLFDDRLLQAFSASKRHNVYGCVMFLDLDNFKPLNDTYGHEVGDQLIIEVGSRLKACVREMDTVARFGGDEFIILLTKLSQDKESARKISMQVAQKISASIAEVYKLTVGLENESMVVTYKCSVSIGVALYKGDEISKEALLLQADEEMYNSKKSGKNRVSYYNNPRI